MIRVKVQPVWRLDLYLAAVNRSHPSNVQVRV